MSKNIISRVNSAVAAAETVLKNNSLNARTSPILQDLFGRNHNYLRISLTERCNLRCSYCMPEEGVKLTKNDHLLTGSEIVSLVNIFVKNGVNKVRFTGGEPLVRKDCVDIIKQVGQIQGLNKIAITTNGILLSKKLKDLKEAGLNQINISLDTLEEKKFEFIAKRRGWSKVMNSIEHALELGYSPLKINCVVMKGINDDEICKFIELTKNKNLDVRFIEYMPFDGNKWNSKKMVSLKDILKLVAQSYSIEKIIKLQDDENDTSKAFKIEGYQGKFGIISSMTDHFCNTCNRIRITADGNLKVCLFGNAEVSLRDALRSNVGEDDLRGLISSAIQRKKAKHADSRANKQNNILSNCIFADLNQIDKYVNTKNKIHSTNAKNSLALETSFLCQTKQNNLFKVAYRYISTSKIVSKNKDDKYAEQTKYWDEFASYYEKNLKKSNGSSTSETKSPLSPTPDTGDAFFSPSKPEFTHFDSESDNPKQVDVGEKKITNRIACASGYIQLNDITFNALIKHELKKGNALIVAQLAGIQASKKTAHLIPLCHQVILDKCDVNFKLDDQTNRIYCEAVCKTSTSKTGVEMEALTACSVSLLTIYDMCKALQKDAVLNDIKLEYKYGGKSDFKRSGSVF